MRDEMKKVPRLRFRGFSEDWELCKLSGVLGEIVWGASENQETLGTVMLRSKGSCYMQWDCRSISGRNN